MNKPMKAFGIELRPRKEGTWYITEFFLFAAICDNWGVARFVDHVLCCHNSGSLVIETKPGTPELAKEVIWEAAHQTLPQYGMHIGNDYENGWKIGATAEWTNDNPASEHSND